MEQKRVWLKGDTHLHTTNTGGVLTPKKMIEKCKKRGLNFIFITDHNYNAVGDSSYYDGDFLIIPGEEYTGKNGHMNVWGSNCPHLSKERPTEYEQYIQVAKDAHENGCMVSVNHPFCKRFGWRFELEKFPMDSVEVWNGSMDIDNITALEWWHKQLLNGSRLPLVGGSDYHRDYFITDWLANPTTYVYAKSNTEKDILFALRHGNSFVTNSPTSTKIVLSCGEFVMGDEVELSDDTEVTLNVEELKKGMRVQIFNNDEIIHEYKAEKTGNYTTTVKDLKKGFVRAQVLYDYTGIMLFIYKLAIRLWQPLDSKLPIPSFAWCITNPLYLV